MVYFFKLVEPKFLSEQLQLLLEQQQLSQQLVLELELEQLLQLELQL